MVGYRFGLFKTDWFEKLVEGRKFAQENSEEYEFAWENTGFSLGIDEESLLVEVNEFGWINILITDFTPEILIFLLVENPQLATKEVLEAFMCAIDAKVDTE